MIIWVKPGVFAPIQNRAEIIRIDGFRILVRSCGRPEDVKQIGTSDICGIELEDEEKKGFSLFFGKLPVKGQ